MYWNADCARLVRDRARDCLAYPPCCICAEFVSDSHLGDFIKDETVVGPEDAASYAMLQEQIKKLLGTLTEREQRVLILRFGLEDGKSRTLEEVGREFKVTRERIRQIEAKALRKLRHPSRARMLKGYDIS